MKIDKTYITTSTCFAEKGFTRAILYDLQKFTYEVIPNSLAEFLENPLNWLDSKTFENRSEDEKAVIEEYLSYCLEQEYVTEIPNTIPTQNFPKLNLNFEYPSVISNISISLNPNFIMDFTVIQNIILETKCYHLQIIVEKGFDLNLIKSYLKLIDTIGLRSIELIVEFQPEFDYQKLIDLYNNIAFIFIYAAPTSEFLQKANFGLHQIFTSEKDFAITHQKSLNFFNVNITLYTESQKHNTYFNRKLHIAANGDIKNAPLNSEVFGNIHQVKQASDILDIVKSKEFQKYWYVHKGMIDVCKDCEFRHMCVDNRIPIKRNDADYFMETECNYNPYIAKWQGEKGYNILKECGITSNKDGFSLNRKKLIAINKELWGDN